MTVQPILSDVTISHLHIWAECQGGAKILDRGSNHKDFCLRFETLNISSKDTETRFETPTRSHPNKCTIIFFPVLCFNEPLRQGLADKTNKTTPRLQREYVTLFSPFL